jgi:hypothetical protein
MKRKERTRTSDGPFVWSGGEGSIELEAEIEQGRTWLRGEREGK